MVSSFLCRGGGGGVGYGLFPCRIACVAGIIGEGEGERGGLGRGDSPIPLTPLPLFRLRWPRRLMPHFNEL